MLGALRIGVREWGAALRGDSLLARRNWRFDSVSISARIARRSAMQFLFPPYSRQSPLPGKPLKRASRFPGRR
jgi:hypothetical protein